MATDYKIISMQIELSKFVQNFEESKVFQYEKSVSPKKVFENFCLG